MNAISSPPNALTVEQLSVTYNVGRGRKLHAVNGVSFSIPVGQTLGLVGESGSGKSTTGLAVLRLIPPAAGSVRLGEVEVTTLGRTALRRIRRRAQMVFQDPYSSLNPSMTVGQLLEEALIVHADLPRAERRAAVERMLESVGLSPSHAARYPHEFSGGQRQRIAIARAMMIRPELVVLDEPVSALDVSTQSQILNLLTRIQAESDTAFLFIAHDLAVVRLMSPQVAVMYLGEIVENGPSARVYDAPAHPYSAALIAATPVPDPDHRKAVDRLILGGDLPSPLNPPSGCRFRTRCPFVMPICAEQPPPPTPIRGGGTAACHLHTSGPLLNGAPLNDFLRERSDVALAPAGG